MSTLRVLVPLDGSALSAAIIPYVRGLEPAVVTLVRVLGPETEAAPSKMAEELELVEMADRLRKQGIPAVGSLVRFGKPAEEILTLAKDLNVGLIALTTHGRSGFDHVVHGSVAEKVIRAARVPVLAVHATEPAPRDAPPVRLFEQVLVPYEGSPLAWRAVETLALLGAAGKGRLTLYGVVESDDAAPVIRTPPPNDVVARYIDLRTEGMRDRLGHGVSRAADLGFDATQDFDVGWVAAKILEWSERHAATLIAMGTHGRSGPSRWVFGSVTEKVLRNSPVPLLICK